MSLRSTAPQGWRRLKRRVERHAVTSLGWIIGLGCLIVLVAHAVTNLYPGLQIQTWVHYALHFSIRDVITALGAIASLLLITNQMEQARRFHRHSQATDVIMHCNERYEALIASMSAIPIVPAPITREAEMLPEVRSYWRRFWGIKADQFDHYISGLVDRDTMTAWQLSTIRHFQRAARDAAALRGGVSARNAWKWIGRPSNEANPWFVAWIDYLTDIAGDKSLKFSRKWDRKTQPSDVHLHIIDALARCEPLFDAWRCAAQEGNMDVAFYRSSLEWQLPLHRAWERQELKALARMRDGEPVSALGRQGHV